MSQRTATDFDLWETECACTLEGWNESCWSVKPGQRSFCRPECLICPRFYGKGSCAEVLPRLWGTWGGSWSLCETMEVLGKGHVAFPHGWDLFLQTLSPGFISDWAQRNQQKLLLTVPIHSQRDSVPLHKS